MTTYRAALESVEAPDVELRTAIVQAESGSEALSYANNIFGSPLEPGVDFDRIEKGICSWSDGESTIYLYAEAE